MVIKNNGYNIGNIVIDTAITLDTKTEIGNADDFQKVANLADMGGVVRVHCKVSGMSLDGAVFVNHVDDKIDIGSVTNYEGNPYVISGTATLESEKMYLTVSMTGIGGQQGAKSTKKS